MEEDARRRIMVKSKWTVCKTCNKIRILDRFGTDATDKHANCVQPVRGESVPLGSREGRFMNRRFR